jgi:hypothetical protein
MEFRKSQNNMQLLYFQLDAKLSRLEFDTSKPCALKPVAGNESRWPERKKRLAFGCPNVYATPCFACLDFVTNDDHTAYYTLIKGESLLL